MRAINHALTGAIIGLTVNEPLAAIPVAFVSHFVCDAIPHYAMNLDSETELKMPIFVPVLLLDAFLCFLLVVALAILQPHHWRLASLCAFIATTPDFMSLDFYRSVMAGRKYVFRGFNRFAKAIQWFQRPIGWVVEIVWLTASICIIAILAS